MSKIDIVCLVCVSAFGLGGCIAPDPPPFPPNSAADPQVHISSKPPGFLGQDETTEQIKVALATNREEATTTQETAHMPRMEHGQMQHHRAPASEKKTLVEEMKKTSDEMKATSDAMKKKSNEAAADATYVCPMHSQVRSDKPGKCPICGMTLIKKEHSHEGH